LYIFYKRDWNAHSFRALKLTSDGLTLADSEEKEIKIGDSSAKVFTSWHFKRYSYDYLLYSNLPGLRIARSSNGILGPYEVHDKVLVTGMASDPTVVQGTTKDSERLYFSKGTVGTFSAHLIWVMKNWFEGDQNLEWPEITEDGCY